MDYNICICGGGSLGVVCAGVFSSQGHKVRLLTGHPDKWSRAIEVLDPEGRKYCGTLNKISRNPKDVVKDSDIVLLCVPGYLIERQLRKIQPYLSEKTIVGSIVSSTGFFFIAHKVLMKNQPLFGFQRVPFISRQKEYGRSGLLLGYKDSLTLAVENIRTVDEIKKMMEKLFMTPVNITTNFLEVSLSNSNPILHTGRLYTMWKESNGLPYIIPPLFYYDWTISASKLIIGMDNEFQQLLRQLNVSSNIIPPLLEYYESQDAIALTDKIKSIKAFQTITSPMKETAKGWVLDFSSRYFTEDFPFGLKFIKDLAVQYNISTPLIDEVYAWGMSMINS